MKKIISLILMLALALTCVFALASCGEPEEKTPDAPVYSEAAAAFITAYKATTPTTVSTTVKTTVLGVTLQSVYNVTKGTDGSVTMTYTVEQQETLESDATVLTGTVVRDAQGNYSGDGDSAIYEGYASSGLDIVIDSSKITDFEVSGNVLRITVAKADTAAVYGKDLGSDAVSVITIANGKVTSVTLNYTAADSSVVEIVSVYS